MLKSGLEAESGLVHGGHGGRVPDSVSPVTGTGRGRADHDSSADWMIQMATVLLERIYSLE